MSGLTFTLKSAPRQRVDLSPLTPDKLKGLGEAAIAGIEIATGNRRVAVGELFAIGGGDTEDLRFVGSTDRLDRIGQGMSGGRITVDGDAGAYLGLGLRGGSIVVRGNAGTGAAVEMRAGTIEIGGAAGDFVGGALPGDMRGMSGGLVVVRGDVGERVGDRMRRGTIIVEGSAGGAAAARMIAGTVIVLGPGVGPCPGYGMKRGTLILRRRAELALPSFSDCGRHDLGFMRILVRAFAGRSARLDEMARSPTVRRFAGDHASGGKGEILIWGD